MAVIAVLLTLRLTGIHSLKEKRAVVRSLVERLRSRLRLSAAETGQQDRLQAAQIGFAVVSGELSEARRLAAEARRFADSELLGRGEVVSMAVEELTIDAEAAALQLDLGDIEQLEGGDDSGGEWRE